ncbi:hypothetical protein V493_05189 [Pseudogymnoascus sp. VKM F-4281 (FW-2241)]|nr:hypothetical protein V493_05189 [Pseudogymnoascus sp. VKM F-4281 (FW-2241)]
MDVFGATAASAQLLIEAVKLGQLIRSIHGKYKGAPKEIEAWRQGIEDFTGIMKDIETLPTLDGYEIHATIESCGTICQELIRIFSSLDFDASDSRSHKTWMAVKGLDKDPVVKKHFEELERLKGTLQLKISVSQVKDVRQTAQDVQFIKAAIQPGTKEDQCMGSLFLTNPADHRDAIITAKGDREEGSCEWVTSTDEYKAWVISPRGLLWLSGGPGKGKTFISIFLTKRLSESGNVIYFFCDNKDSSRNTAVAILRGLLYQLIGQYPRLLHHVLTPWKVEQDSLFNSFEGLWRIFQTMLEDLGTDLICVLDGLDECADDSLQKLLRKFEMLFTESIEKHKLRLIILSRRHPDCLERALGSFARIDLDSDQVSNQSDINSYITSRVAQLAKRKTILPSIVKHIEETFREKSEDTFLWVSFMANDLEKQTVSGIKKALQTLPKGLNEVYERILLSIKPDDTVIIATMLQWITLALRPLTVPELAEAMRIHASGHVSKERICLDYIGSCGHLLQVSGFDDNDESSQGSKVSVDRSVTFVHQSVKDFLFGLAKHHMISAFQVNKARGDPDITCQLLSSMQDEWLQCVETINRGVFQKNDAYPLAQYAQLNWYRHLQQLQDKALSQLVDSNTSFFSDSSAVRNKWWIACFPFKERNMNMLRFACDLGLVALARKTLKRKKLASPFTFQKITNTALFLAINSGNPELIQLLLKYGANLEMQFACGIDQNALYYIAKRGFLEIFQLCAGTKRGKHIIDEDIRAGQRGVKRDSLLHLAARSGSSQLCSLLLERYHYNIDETGAWGQTPLYIVVSRGFIDLARIFVKQWGASIAAADKILEAVAGSGSEEELELVVSEWKIDINTRNESGQTILHFVSEGSLMVRLDNMYCNFVARCLELGADPSLRSTNGDAPFHLYQWFRHSTASPLMPTILLLHDGRLGVNDQGNGGNTLLHNCIQDAVYPHHNFRTGAIFNGLISLLDVGADRTLVNSNGMTALQLAKTICDNYTQKIREYVIERLADISNIFENYATVSNHPQRLDPLDWD